MDSRQLAHCVMQIEKNKAEGNHGNILILLGDLDKVHVTAEQLETTDVVKCLYRLLRRCSDNGVKKTARSLLSKWKRQYGGVRPPQDPGPSGDVSHADSVAEGSCSSSSIRSKCVQLLLAAICPDPQDKAADLAADLERHIHELHKSNQLKYKACVRSKVSNLRNPKNMHLRQGLLSGSLSPEAFARMSAEEMASAELRRLREEFSSRGVSERQLPQGVEGTSTQKIRCKRCGGTDCRVTQVSRGALFLPAWVRQSGPDDDAMTFVTCSGCGQQWYHSGWVCL